MLKTTSEILKRRGLSGPTVVLDKKRAIANIRRMAARAQEAGAIFRPHFKTHQSAEVGRWYRDEGITRITVSSLDMAARFADLGWHDITVALLHDPGRTMEADRLARQLADRGGRLGLLVDDAGVAAGLARDLQAPCDLWLKVDTGYGRTGLRWDDRHRLQAALAAVGGHVTARGLLTHSGHSYHARGIASVQAVYDESIARLGAARIACGRADLQLSFGDTPCCSLAADLSACDELRPGNFVFYDLMQLQIGSCGVRDLAAAVVCPVLGVYPARHQIVIHGGAVHLSKEHIEGPDGRPRYGCLGTVHADGFGDVLTQAPLAALSQEHGVVDFAGDFPRGMVPGDLVLVWPVHSCLICDQSDGQTAKPATF